MDEQKEQSESQQLQQKPDLDETWAVPPEDLDATWPMMRE